MHPHSSMKPQETLLEHSWHVTMRQSLALNRQWPIETEFRMSDLNRIPPPTLLTAGKRRTSFQPSIPTQSVFLPNNWRKVKITWYMGMTELHKQGSNGTAASGWEKCGEDTELNGPVFKLSAQNMRLWYSSSRSIKCWPTHVVFHQSASTWQGGRKAFITTDHDTKQMCSISLQKFVALVFPTLQRIISSYVWK
jgi:hypothetical protein